MKLAIPENKILDSSYVNWFPITSRMRENGTLYLQFEEGLGEFLLEQDIRPYVKDQPDIRVSIEDPKPYLPFRSINYIHKNPTRSEEEYRFNFIHCFSTFWDIGRFTKKIEIRDFDPDHLVYLRTAFSLQIVED